MNIIKAIKTPKSSFAICEARGCTRLAPHIIIITSHYQLTEKQNMNEVQEYSFCDKHLEQFKKEVSLMTPALHLERE